MNVLVVDTSSWISYFKGEPNGDLDLALKEARVYLPPLVVAELLSARMKPGKRRELYSFLKELPLCESGFEHWVRVGDLRSRLSAKGIHTSTPDAHIAQCCLDLDGYLVSEDRVFVEIADRTDLRIL